MPLYDFACDECNEQRIDVYIHNTKIIGHTELCTCGQEMEMSWHKTGGHNVFIAFDAVHMTRLAGSPQEITSLADIRKLEKKYESQQLCFDAYSFDGAYGDERTGVVADRKKKPKDYRDIPYK